MDAAARREALVALYKEVAACERCPLHETRNRAVFGSGNADAGLMFVGEAPGAEEDRLGLPFVGRAGKFLSELLDGIGMKREEVFIANVLKSRPPGNRDPQPTEIEACRPYLDKQVALIQPRVIGTLGNFATKLLTGSPIGITKVRGTAQQHTLGGREVLLLPLFHPAAGLRTPAVADQLRQDFELIPELLQAPVVESVDEALREVEAEAIPDPTPSGGKEALSGSGGLPPRQSAGDAPDAADQLGLFGGR